MEITVDRWHLILRGIWILQIFPYLRSHPVQYFIFLLALVCFFIWALRKTHAGEIYVIWLFFTFFFVLSFLLDSASLNLSAGEIVADVYSYLDDADTEAKIVFGTFVLLIVPQLLTYFLSGLSGSASPPVFVSQITNIAVWSLVKFLAAFSGIVTATSLYSDDPWSTATGTFMLVPLVVAFFLVWVRHASGLAVEFLYQKKVFSPFRCLHEKFTRYRAPEDEDASTRTIKEIREAMRKEMIAMVREGMREGVREGIQELMRDSEMIHELMRKIDPMD
jgi:hypothetical protein